MPFRLDLTLTDATGQPPVGGGRIQLVLRKDAAAVFDSGLTAYASSPITLSAPTGNDWTHVIVRIEPESYSLQGVTLNRSGKTVYSNNAAARSALSDDGNLTLALPLLRIREAPGAIPGRDPTAGDDLKSIWLERRQGKPAAIYRELLSAGMLAPRTAVAAMAEPDRSGKPSPFIDPDAANGWDRFKTSARGEDPAASGASLLLEYGETGSVTAAGPRFLVGVWVPSRPSPAPAGPYPVWRDVAAFLHPSTAKSWFPESSWPYTVNYPFVVSNNTNVGAGQPVLPFQPYVNLALKHLTGIWSQFQRTGRDEIFVVPILPHPKPRSQDEADYGLPFSTQSGLARLLAEVNLYLHQIRYGWPGMGLDTFAGAAAPGTRARSPADATAFFTDSVKPPVVRRVAAAAFSASSTLMNRLMTQPSTSNSRFPADRWSARTGDPFRAWTEAWVIDPIYGTATVEATTFETSLQAWFGAYETRRFHIVHSGTTGGNDPDALYPRFGKRTASRQRVTGTDTTRVGNYWSGQGDRWAAMFCTNPLLTVSTANTALWPPFETTSDPDAIHGFTFALASGMILGWTLLGQA